MRVLLADDHHVVREALALFLRRAASDIEVVDASNIEQALTRIGVGMPFDAIMLDYNMPGMNGLAGLDMARKAAPRTPIAILSGDITAQQCFEAIDRGATGVVLKEMHGTALLSALRQIAAGERYIPGTLGVAWKMREMAGDPGDEERARLGYLTHREMDCLRLLLRGSSNRQIADSLSLAEVTIKLHLHSAYRKMGARNRSDAVRIAMLKGMTAL